MSKKLLNQKKKTHIQFNIIQYIFHKLSKHIQTYMFQVFGPPGVGGGCVCSVFMVSHPCGVGWGGKGVAYAVWENYNSWCIQTSGT